MARKTSSGKPLTGRVALVAGATRGAGRGIARALGEAGATVYCTGRSVTGKPSPYRRPETINETASLIKDAGGTAIAVRVDHTNEREVAALFRRILRAHHRLDVVVDSVAGEDPLLKSYGFLWQADLKNADAMFRQGLTSRIITAKHAALAMKPAKRGLIVEVTENDIVGGGANPIAHAVKVSQKLLPLAWASELAPHGIAVLAITPGFLRSESMLEHFGVTEDTWREGGQEGSKLPGVGVAAVRGARDRRAGRGSRRARAHRHALQLVGAGARVRLHRLRRPAAGLGAPQDRLLGAPAGVDRAVSHGHRPGNPVADDARRAGQEVPGKDPVLTR